MTERTERATKKRRREASTKPEPWSDLRLDTLPEGEEKARVELAVRCFEAGDFARMRAVADELAKSPSKEVQAIAAALRARTGVDVVQLVVIGACALLLVAVALRYVF